MNFEEYAAKPRLAEVGINVPRGILVSDVAAAATAAAEIGNAVIKAQIPIGKRGKAGGIQLAATAEEAETHARNILGMEIGGYRVAKVLVEEKSDIRAEYYAAVLNDPVSKGPMIMFSTEGGMDIEEIAAATPEKLKQQAIDIRHGFSRPQVDTLIDGLDLMGAEGAIADVLCKLYQAYTANDAELLEINPLIVTADGSVVALDCKFVMDDSAVKRHPELAKQCAPEILTELEHQGEAAGIKYIELEGDVGVLANGAGLTMTTMDVIRHHGGEPANFCEIGGEAYTQAKTALVMVLAKPGIKSLVVNFCGAFARCDVMMEGLLNAWDELNPTLPVFFSIAGTGDEEAIRMLNEKLDMSPMPDMSNACEKAVQAARATG
jgi:succinyl-CoA synthetase beta subunit